MKHLLFICFLLVADKCLYAQSTAVVAPKPYAIAIHGGAGTITPENLSEEHQKQYKASLEKALTAGEQILSSGGAAIDAVQAVIMMLEDDSLFNAGKGSVYNHDEQIEMDASIMNGKDLNAGAVAGVRTIKNPILAARYVMDKSKHVMFSGAGAEQFAKDNELEIVDPGYFETERNKREIKQIKEKEGKKSSIIDDKGYSKFGTVGAVALDKEGNLAAGTSTGGMANKKFGRIGDSPIIGAGTYADNTSCAVSCTGWGEYFIRLVMAKSISDKMSMQGLGLRESVNYMIHDKLERMEATGGVIAVDKYANVVIDFNTKGMYRAWATSNGDKGIKMFE